MKRAPRSRQRHDLYAKYHDYDSEISDLLGECGVQTVAWPFSHQSQADAGDDCDARDSRERVNDDNRLRADAAAEVERS